MIKEGDIALLQDEKSPKRNTWKMAIVEGLIKGADNEIRRAKVRKARYKGKSEVLSRPIQKLFPLEIQMRVLSWKERMECKVRVK